MVQRRHLLLAILLVGIAASLAMLLWGRSYTVSTKAKGMQDVNSLIQLAKPIRPAAIGENPKDNEFKKQPPPVKPETLRPPSRAEMLGACAKQPKCRKKLEGAQKAQKPSSPLPAATTESPEERQFKKQLPPLGPGQAPRSERLSPTDSSLFSWLTPFGIAEAQAQTAFLGYSYSAK